MKGQMEGRRKGTMVRVSQGMRDASHGWMDGERDGQLKVGMREGGREEGGRGKPGWWEETREQDHESFCDVRYGIIRII